MLSFIVGLICYWTGPDLFGGSLINAVDGVNTLYWILAIIGGTLMIFISGAFALGGGAVGHEAGGKMGAVLGSIVGGGASLLLMVFALLKVGIMIWLTAYLTDTIDPNIANLDGLTTSQVIAFVIVLIIPFTGRGSASKSTTKSK